MRGNTLYLRRLSSASVLSELTIMDGEKRSEVQTVSHRPDKAKKETAIVIIKRKHIAGTGRKPIKENQRGIRI